MRGCVEKLKMGLIKIKSESNVQQVVALDIGTSKTATIIGEIMEGGGVKVLGKGSCPANGLEKGVVVSIEDTVNSIREAVNEAEVLTRSTIDTVYVGISGRHIGSASYEGQAAIKHREVSQADMDNAQATAQATAQMNVQENVQENAQENPLVNAQENARGRSLPVDHEVIHALPREYSVDGQGGIKDPLGMSGYRLQANVHIVTGATHPINNVRKCVQKSGFGVADIVAGVVASGYAVLEEEEKELGVCLLDIGGGTTDIIVFEKGSIAFTGLIEYAGESVTSDIALFWKTPISKAEEIKLKYGCALQELVGEDETIEVPGIAGRSPRAMKRSILAEIIESRYEEIFCETRDCLRKQGADQLAKSGFVLTGGSSRIEGVCELAASVFNAPVRVGQPRNGIEGLSDTVNNPAYATGVGILRYVALTSLAAQHGAIVAPDMLAAWERIKHWFSNLF